MIFYTDGSAHPTNPGPGGFGVVILDDNMNLLDTYSKQTDEITTNNREEMKAIIWAVCYAVLHGEDRIHIYTDSSYALNTFVTWMYNWERNGWIKGDGKEPENLDLIKEMYTLKEKYVILFDKVKGHNKDKYNELADKLATGQFVK